MTDTRSSGLLDKSGTRNLFPYFVKKNIKYPSCQMRVPPKAYQRLPLLDPGTARPAAFRAWPRVPRPEPQTTSHFKAGSCGCAAGATFSAAPDKKVVLVMSWREQYDVKGAQESAPSGAPDENVNPGIKARPVPGQTH